MPERRSARVAATLVALLGLLLAACGGGHDTPSTAESPPPSANASTLAAGPTSSLGAINPDPTTAPAPTAAPTTATTAPLSPAVLTWTACAPFDCATLQVPLDWSKPAGRSIGLALVRQRAKGPGARVGSLFVNPGGPGASGVDEMKFFVGVLSADLQARFDIVSFDPRGVGRSAPVRCLSTAQLDQYFDVDPSPDTPAERQALTAAALTLAQGCKARDAELISHVDTDDVARDLDAMRGAVGDARLTYLGFSYGTAIGTEYAKLFPTHARALTLDGAIDPTLDQLGLAEGQGDGFDTAFAAFLADCAARAGCAWQPGGDLRAAFDKLSVSIDAKPLKVGRRSLGPSEFTLGVAQALYSKSSWPTLARAISLASGGQGNLLLALFDGIVGRNADGSYSNLQEANAAVNCLDKPAPADQAVYDRAAQAAAQRGSAFGPTIIYSAVLCTQWQVPVIGTTAPVRAAGSPPIVVVGSTRDPATPYVWAKALASQLVNGVLLTRDGDGHVGYLYSGCIRAAVDAYLIDLTVPATGTTCPS